MSNPFIVSSDVGSPASTIGGQPIFFNTAGAVLVGVSATYATTASSAVSSSYATVAYSASYASHSLTTG